MMFMAGVLVALIGVAGLAMWLIWTGRIVGQQTAVYRYPMLIPVEEPDPLSEARARVNQQIQQRKAEILGNA